MLFSFQIQDEKLTMVTGGREVKLLRTVDQLPQEDATLVRPSVLLLNSRDAIDSGSSESEDSGNEEGVPNRAQTPTGNNSSDASSQGWGCSIL